jgi:hypothetical protein
MAIIAGVVLTLCALVTQPHEFIIKPAQLQIESDAKLPFSILATHVFMIGEEVAPIDVKENHTLEHWTESSPWIAKAPRFSRRICKRR